MLLYETQAQQSGRVAGRPPAPGGVCSRPDARCNPITPQRWHMHRITPCLTQRRRRALECWGRYRSKRRHGAPHQARCNRPVAVELATPPRAPDTVALSHIFIYCRRISHIYGLLRGAQSSTHGDAQPPLQGTSGPVLGLNRLKGGI
jgi:hypothetical protein